MKRPSEIRVPTASNFSRFTPHVFSWSGRWDLNPRQPAWKAGTLPLSYARPSLVQPRVHPYDCPLWLCTQCLSPACVCSLWWAGKDSNLGSRWQQIYSLPPLATWVPALNTCTQNPKRSIILAVSFVRMMKNEEQASPSTAPPSL